MEGSGLRGPLDAETHVCVGGGEGANAVDFPSVRRREPWAVNLVAHRTGFQETCRSQIRVWLDPVGSVGKAQDLPWFTRSTSFQAGQSFVAEF